MPLQLLSDLEQEAQLVAILTITPLVEQRQTLKAQAAQIEAQLDAINDEMKTTLVGANLLECYAAGHKVTLNMEAKRDTLDKQKLLEQGVTTEQIKRATKTTTSILLNVRPVKESA